MPVGANTLRLLMDAGLVGDDLLAIVASIDADMSGAAPAKPRTAQALRQERYRLKASQNVTSDATCDVTEVTPASPAPLPPKETPPAPPKEITLFTPTLPHSETDVSSQGPKRKIGTRLPDDWVLTRVWAEWALAEFPQIDAAFVRLEADKFKDYWRSKSGKDATKMDWLATWRNWMRSAIGRIRPDRHASTAPPLRGLAAVQDRLRREIASEQQRTDGEGSDHHADDGGVSLLTIEHQRRHG